MLLDAKHTHLPVSAFLVMMAISSSTISVTPAKLFTAMSVSQQSQSVKHVQSHTEGSLQPACPVLLLTATTAMEIALFVSLATQDTTSVVVNAIHVSQTVPLVFQILSALLVTLDTTFKVTEDVKHCLQIASTSTTQLFHRT